MLSGDLIQDGIIHLDTDNKGFTFNGKSSGSVIEIPSDRQKRINELTKAAKEVEDSTKNLKINLLKIKLLLNFKTYNKNSFLAKLNFRFR